MKREEYNDWININPNLKENINYKFKISTKGKFYKLSNLCRNNNYNY